MESVSIILPTFNCDKTVEAAVRSVIEQDYRAKEIIVCDGASTDNTLAIIESYRDHINVLASEKDTGIYNAMNKGVKYATGHWLYFLGADDRLFNRHVLSEIFEQRDTSRFDFIYGNVVLGDTSKLFGGTFNFFKLLRNNICHQAIFVRKALLSELGGFDLSYSVLADWDLNLKIWRKRQARKLYVSQVVAYYGLNGTSNQGNHSEEAQIIKQLYEGKKFSYLFTRILDKSISYWIPDLLK